jgi:ABC-2 type transport system ATP-binding protein
VAATTRVEPLVVEGLCKRYGATHALRDVSLGVAAGTITGLLGPNGAGKTTLLRILCGLAFADSGTARVVGFDVRDVRARASIGYAPEVVTFPRGPTLEEFLVFQTRLGGATAADAAARARAVVERLGLGEVRAREAATLSKGMRRRVGIAHALLADPPVLLLDEPGADLDPVGRRELDLLLKEEKDRGKAILLSSHMLLEVEPVLDDVAMLHKGEVLAHGAVAQMIPTRHLVEITLADFGPTLRQATAHLLPVFHESEGRMTVATNDPELVRELPRLLESAGVRYDSVTMRRPNLRDLFFTLLGSRSS